MPYFVSGTGFYPARTTTNAVHVGALATVTAVDAIVTLMFAWRSVRPPLPNIALLARPADP